LTTSRKSNSRSAVS